MEGIREWQRGIHAVAASASEGSGEAPARGEPAEEVIVRAAQAGARVALEQLVARHKGPLYVLCRGVLGSAEDAEDAVQETFLRAFRSLDRFRGGSAFRTWLYRIALNVCLRWKSSRPPTEPWNEDGSPCPDLGPSPESIALRHLRVAEALRSLLPRHRALLLLREFEGWSVPEIAEALGWKEKRVRNELYKARLALAEWRRRDAEGDDR
jgi:RNA polymerase sigma-70 factor (ECF subfamily)